MDISPHDSLSHISYELSLSTWQISTSDGDLPPIPIHLDAPLSTYPYYDMDYFVYKYLQMDSYPVFYS